MRTSSFDTCVRRCALEHLEVLRLCAI